MAQGGQRFFCSSSDSNFGHRLVFQGGHDKHTYPHKSLSCPPYPPSNHIHSPTFKEAELISCFFTKQPKILRPLSLGWPYVTARKVLKNELGQSDSLFLEFKKYEI